MTPPDADAGSLDAELDALYAAPPEDFVTARAASAKRLRAAGRRDEASAIAAARKPTAGAALVNALARAEPTLVAAAIDAVEAARTAIERGEGVREALEHQRAAVDAAEAPLAALAAAGASAAVARQATETLRAAVLDAELQPSLRAGRLTTAGLASGFGALPATPAPRRAAAPAAPAKAAVPKPDRQAEAAAAREAKRAAAAHQRELAAAQRDLQAAERAEAAALRALDKAQREAERSTAARSAAAERLAGLERATP